MNELHIGFKREVKPVAGALFIGDDLPRKYRAQISTLEMRVDLSELVLAAAVLLQALH
jgi:hypothetical protein